jgi:dienelactone hydrolase
MSAPRDRLRSLLGIDLLSPTLPAELRRAGPGSLLTDTPVEAVVRTAPGSEIHSYLLIPEPSRSIGAGVVLVAGHGRGIADLVTSGEPDSYHHGLARDFVRAGFTVLCPEMVSFGSRRSAQVASAEPYAPEDSSCRVDAPRYLFHGSTVLARRVADAAAAADALRRFPGVDPDRVGVAGGSGGGAVSLFLAALDERIAGALVASYFNTFGASIAAMPHCPCNHVPGLLEEDEDGGVLDMADIAALIAPRPLVIEAGERDRIFPIQATRKAFAGLPEVWQGAGAPAPELVVEPTDHHFTAGRSLEAFAALLG